jgi:integrase
MPTKITTKAIRLIQPMSILWDAEVRGFNARRQFSDIVTYSVIYRTNDGRQRWHKLGRHPILTPDLARREAIKILRTVTLGGDPSAARYEERHSITVAQLCEMYQADMQSLKNNGKKATTIRGDVSRIKNQIIPGLGRYKVATITTEQLERFMNEQTKGSAKRIIGLTGAIFSFAVKRKLRADNPVTSIEKPADVKKLRRLNNDEYAALHSGLNNVNSTAADVILFLALTGWRRSEANNLRWTEVDLERKAVILDDSKTGRSIRPLSGAAIDILLKRDRSAQFVFAFDGGKPVANLNESFARLGLASDVTPHTLRHSFASLAADMGLADHTISALLGHRNGNITSRYMHLGDKALLDAADLVAGETMRLMQGTAADDQELRSHLRAIAR